MDKFSIKICYARATYVIILKEYNLSFVSYFVLLQFMDYTTQSLVMLQLPKSEDIDNAPLPQPLTILFNLWENETKSESNL